MLKRGDGILIFQYFDRELLIKNEKWYSVFVVSDVACYQYVLILERGEMAAAYTLLKSYLLLTVQKKLSPLDFIC